MADWQTLDRPPVTLQRFTSLTKTSEHRACTRMSYGSGKEKHPEVTKICMYSCEMLEKQRRDQCAEAGDSKIIVGKRVMRTRLESNTMMT